MWPPSLTRVCGGAPVVRARESLSAWVAKRFPTWQVVDRALFQGEDAARMLVLLRLSPVLPDRCACAPLRPCVCVAWDGAREGLRRAPVGATPAPSASGEAGVGS